MLAFYNQYWCKTQTLISDDIKTIIWRQNLIFVNTPYPFCQVKDTYIDDDIIKNPQLSQIILIITWFASHRGLQVNQSFFIWCVSKGHSLVFPKKLHYKFNCLKCFYFLLSKIIAGISNDKISMRIWFHPPTPKIDMASSLPRTLLHSMS